MRYLAAVSLWIVIAGFVAAAQTPAPPRPQPPRDTSAQATVAPTGTATVSGRVVAADTGRPVARARVMLISGSGSAGARALLTGNDGTFAFPDLPAGRYTLNAAKTGYVSIVYGQRRPLQAGTPLDISDGQALTGLDLLLPRGSAVAGRITDETGEALPGATVRVARYQYQQGTRVLQIVGSAQSDDQGSYRVWGLDPGTYYVSALARFPVIPPFAQIAGAAAGGPGGGRGGRGLGGAPRGAAGGRGAPAPLLNADSDAPEGETYAPTYYPGVASVNEARPVTVGLGAETLGVDFGVLLVRTGRLAGRVMRADAAPASGGNVILLPDGSARAGGRQAGGRIDADGNFAIADIPPGRYMLQARLNDREKPQSARQTVTIAEGEAANVLVTLSLPGSISGVVRFAGASSSSPDPALFRVAAPTAEAGGIGGGQARVQRDGTFTVPAVEAGAHWIRAPGGQADWTLTSVIVDGRETIDTPLDVRGGQAITGVTLTFTDRITQVSGTLTDGRGTPLTGYTVLAFPTDASLWRPQARQIMTTRPDQNGKYQLRGLPAGTYYLTAIDPEQQGEWYEPEFLEAHRSGAARLTLLQGDVKAQDFALAPP